MPSPDPTEATIITNAHEFVQAWLRTPKRRPFGQAVRRAEQKLWGDLHDAELHREAFRKAANAIRIGYGHAYANPRPLVEIVRRVMRR